MNDELALASDIQTSLLPPASISWPGGEVACFCKPTFEIGGDFYSYHFTKQDHFALAVGDASGHGVSAALIMAATLSLFDSSFKLNLNPCERLSLLDQELISYCEDRHQNCSFCYLELDSNSIYIANAGGIPPLIRKHNGEAHWKKVCGLPLGHRLGSELGYVGVQIPVNDGDFVVLFSDGAVEANNSQQELTGMRQARLANASPDRSQPAGIVRVLGAMNGCESIVPGRQPQLPQHQALALGDPRELQRGVVDDVSDQANALLGGFPRSGDS